MTLLSRFFLVPLLLGAAAASLLTSCQQNRKAYPVMFLSESNGAHEGAGFVVKHRSRFYTKLPILSLDNFEKFSSMLADDGTYGVELFLKKEYRMRLYLATQGNIGKCILPVVNGIPLAPMKITAPIMDGELIIWEGLNGYDLKQISRTLKPLHEELEKKRYKDKNPRPKPEKPDVKKQSKDFNDRTIPELYSSPS